MALRDNVINLTLKMHISMWDALKLRVAGLSSFGNSSKKAEEDIAVTIARWEEKQEKSKEQYLKRYLRHTFGVCPDCKARRTLAIFELKMKQEQKEIDEES